LIRNYRWFLALSLLALVFKSAAAATPNVVFIISDDQGWNDYGFMGNEQVKTPHLDHLAKRSLVFKHGYVTSPLCRPSLASIVTGLYPHQHGVTGNDVNGMQDRAKLDLAVRDAFHRQPSFIKSFVANGYLAHQSGKWWEGSWRDGGFTHGMTHGDPKRNGRHGDEGLKIGRTGIAPVTEFIDHAVEEGKPFLIWYAPFMPHTPHNPPERLLKKYRDVSRPQSVAKYYAMCEWFDETCGKLLNHLEAKELTENTIVVYICDNGWAATETNADDPAQKQWSRYALRSKGSPFELGIRTPIMISWPQHVSPGEPNELVQSIDLFPTIAHACGIKTPFELPGIDLLNEAQRSKRTKIFGAMHSIHNMTVGNPDDTLQYRWVIDGSWKLLVRHDGNDTTQYKKVHDWDRVPLRLYNLEKDPHERENLATKEPSIVLRLRKTMDEWHQVAK